MKVLTLSGYFRLPDDADVGVDDNLDVHSAMKAFTEYWLGPAPKEIDAVMPSEIPKKPGGAEADAIWEKFIEVVFKGRRVFIMADVEDVKIDNAPEMIG